MFNDPLIVEYVDEDHSTDDEIRMIAIGITAAYGLTYLVYTEPGENETHFITARRAEKWMVDYYEKSRARS
ncbi:MAG: BrnT family toxin [Acidobacteria bacterium]|nr:BrnT family toxin [Acidobacteriota bacterium]